MAKFWFKRRIPVIVQCTQQIVLEDIPDDYELQLVITPVFIKMKKGDTEDAE